MFNRIGVHQQHIALFIAMRGELRHRHRFLPDMSLVLVANLAIVRHFMQFKLLGSSFLVDHHHGVQVTAINLGKDKFTSRCAEVQVRCIIGAGSCELEGHWQLCRVKEGVLILPGRPCFLEWPCLCKVHMGNEFLGEIERLGIDGIRQDRVLIAGDYNTAFFAEDILYNLIISVCYSELQPLGISSGKDCRINCRTSCE